MEGGETGVGKGARWRGQESEGALWLGQGRGDPDGGTMTRARAWARQAGRGSGGIGGIVRGHGGAGVAEGRGGGCSDERLPEVGEEEEELDFFFLRSVDLDSPCYRTVQIRGDSKKFSCGRPEGSLTYIYIYIYGNQFPAPGARIDSLHQTTF